MIFPQFKHSQGSRSEAVSLKWPPGLRLKMASLMPAPHTLFLHEYPHILHGINHVRSVKALRNHPGQHFLTRWGAMYLFECMKR